MNDIELTNVLFETKDIFGKNIRTTKDYWKKIFLIKHKELVIGKKEVVETIQMPDEVRKSV